MLKTDSLREAMTRSCRWCQANPEKFTIFSWRAATLKRPEKRLVCLPLSDGDVLSWITPGSWTTSRCRYWRGYQKISHSCCSTLSVIRTSNSPPLSMTMTAPISCLRSLCGNAFCITRSSQGTPQAEHLPEPKPACHLPKATGRMYSRM
ncbi:Phage tail completion protein R [Escherichia coli]|uniref:Phage tail completion protein R n=1 Tax=Escherichia coli TaxID=562 RepID=A0A2X3KC24_ECOLX|nr:Phage tail completion protein R [Escherichia coli]